MKRNKYIRLHDLKLVYPLTFKFKNAIINKNSYVDMGAANTYQYEDGPESNLMRKWFTITNYKTKFYYCYWEDGEEHIITNKKEFDSVFPGKPR
jgi:hypothetical protein